MSLTFPQIMFILLLLPYASTVHGGLLTYGGCQAACAGLVVACYTAAGFTFGTVVASAATPAVIIGCNAAFGACSAKCALLIILPTP